MRILWVKMGGLWPLNTGGRLRSFHIVSELSRRHRIVLLTTHGPEDDPQGLAANLPHCERVLSLPHHPPKLGSLSLAWSLLQSWFSGLPVDMWKWRVPALREQVKRLIEDGDVDLCVADFLFAAANVPLTPPVPVVLFEHNVEHVIWTRLCQLEPRSWRRLLLKVEASKMRRYEASVCARATRTIAVSDVDGAVLAANSPGADVRTVATGVDPSYFVPNGDPESPAALVFTGSMDWYPNEDAILHFMQTILPLLRRVVPAVTLTVVGRNPTRRLRDAAAGLPVRITGRVDDVRPYVSRAAIYVVPLRMGGGTRLKIFEALAMGKPVVSTTIGAEGLPLVPGEHFIRSDEPAEFARAVGDLVSDPRRREALGAAGRRLMEERYSWPQAAHEFETRCGEVVHRPLR